MKNIRRMNSHMTIKPRKTIIILLVSILIILALSFLLVKKYDFDQDGSTDSYKIGKNHLHVFWTKVKDDDSLARETDNLIHSALLFDMLRQNDFSFGFINKATPAEVEYLKAFASEHTKDSRTDKDKAIKIMDWLYNNIPQKEETDIIEGIKILTIKKGLCELNGAFIALMESIGIKGRYVSDAKGQGTELFVDGRWVFFNPNTNKCFDKSAIELQEAKILENINIAYYWRTPQGKLRRKKLYYQPSLDKIFKTDKGLDNLTWENFNAADYKIGK